jgi:hypothetical protein
MKYSKYANEFTGIGGYTGIYLPNKNNYYNRENLLLQAINLFNNINYKKLSYRDDIILECLGNKWALKINSTSDKVITNFSNFAVKLIGYYDNNTYYTYHVINNEEIPQNIPVIYNNYCNCVLTKQIIFNVITNYNREYGVNLNEYMKYFEKSNLHYWHPRNVEQMLYDIGRPIL